VTEHDQFRDLLGAYVLGALSLADRAQLEEHLPSCPRCRDEVVDLAPIPGLLAQVDPGDLDTIGPDAAAVVTDARKHLDRLRRSRRRWRGAAGAAAAVAAFSIGVALIDSDGRSTTPERDTIELVLDAGPSVDGSIAADERGWGTYVHVALEGLPERDRYRIWAVDTSGTWHEVGSWLPTDDSAASLGASTHLRLGEIERVVVTSADSTDTLLEASPR
jgi:anti-sigma-K factor RskA